MNDLQVFVSNEGTEKGIVCDCVAIDNTIQINHIAFTEEISKIKQMNRV